MQDVKMRCTEPDCPVDVFMSHGTEYSSCPVCYLEAKVCGVAEQEYAKPQVADEFFGEADVRAPMPSRWDWPNVTFWDCFKEGTE